VQLDEIRETCEFLPTPRRLETACRVIEAGTVGATYAKCIGVSTPGGDRHRHVDRMADDLAPNWRRAAQAVSRRLAHHIDGEPSFDAGIRSRLPAPTRLQRSRLLATACVRQRHPVGV